MRYPGGKGQCFKRIINLMPPHRVYIETHLGGGSVLRNKAPATVSIGIDKDERVIANWRQHYPDLARLLCCDAIDFLRGHDFRGDELVYSDPPYLRHLRRKQWIYRLDYTVEQHLQLLAQLKDLPCSVMISGYHSELYDRSLSGWLRLDFTGASHVGPRTESLWMNFQPPEELHDYRYLGETFRERERIKRQQARLRRRIETLPQHERNAFVHWVRQTFDGTSGSGEP